MEHQVSFFAEPRSWVAIAFVIFFVIFGKKLWGVLAGILDKRADTIRTELSEAERLRGEAEAMLKDSAFEVTPVDGSCTVMLAVPCAATSVLEPVINFVPLFTV